MTQTQTKLPLQQQPPNAGGAKLVIISAVIALAAVVLTNVYIAKVKRQAQEQGITVFLLTRDVTEGKPLKKGTWATITVPKSFKESLDKINVITDERYLQNRVGKTFARSAIDGSFITTTMFERRTDEEDHTLIDKGKVLVSLPIEGANQPGTLRPLMKVNIVAPFQTGGQIPEVLTVMENVSVFALGKHTIADEEAEDGKRRIGNYRTLTIMVEPVIARQLSMIQKLAAGNFELLVRNPGDESVPKVVDKGEINPRVLDLLKSQLPRSATVRSGL